jgi:hypothetical protein
MRPLPLLNWILSGLRRTKVAGNVPSQTCMTHNDYLDIVADPQSVAHFLLARTAPYQIWHAPGTQTRHHEFRESKKYIDAVRRKHASALPLRPDAVCEFPANTYRGAASFQQGLDGLPAIDAIPRYFSSRDPR